MLKSLKAILGISEDEKDELLSELITLAKEEVKEYCNIEDDAKLETLTGTIKQMVIYKYNRLGSEGASAENFAGASFTYMTEYPDSILSVLKKNRRAKLL